jgi:FAD/FMN-containing dehydrogenase
MANHGAPVVNFGANVVIRPAKVFLPRSEAELLQLMTEHHGRPMRAVGRLHSWSQLLETDGVVFDLRHFNSVRVHSDEMGPVLTVGAGSQIKHVLAQLDRQKLTLPAIGLISEQTLVGASATGTHGSGRHCMSHYLTAVRIAGYDATSGKASIREIREGSALRAASCSLGCLGIITSVELRPRPQYFVEECLTMHDALNAVLSLEGESPLQQFYFFPWSWRFLGQHRREVAKPKTRLAPLYHAYWFLLVDVTLHVALRTLVRTLRSNRAIKAFYRYVVPGTLIRGWRVIDKSHRMLIMEHELFRHIEIEMFVKRERLEKSLNFVRELLMAFDGDLSAINHATRAQLEKQGLMAEIEEAAGCYTHHYPICIRRVLPDDTFLSMASGTDDSWYALSFISYAAPSDRAGFQRFANLLSRGMIAMLDARPHWGKVCPLTAKEAERLYPHWGEFLMQCQEFDPAGNFQNDWLRRLISNCDDYSE